ncbi:MAG: GxxExxY protein [Planctomycetes bacterium]|nr:GxxExxY protein [Planctomycetota bacterium]
MVDLIYKDEVYAIVGAAIEVHRELGPGFLEAVYQEAMQIELTDRQIPHSSQPRLQIVYKGRVLEKYYVADFVCYDCIMVELKAQKELTGVDEAQLINQLKATKMRVGVLINLGSRGKLEWQRFVT